VLLRGSRQAHLKALLTHLGTVVAILENLPRPSNQIESRIFTLGRLRT
jgi:hypothetical protein